ncbi:MAG: ATP-binding protein [Pseudomonadota bacterium]
MPQFTVKATDFRILEQLEWRPEGVCLLAGPNGAGKTTVLDVLLFLRALWDSGHEAALNAVGGTHLQRIGAEADQPVKLEVRIDDIVWRLRFPMSGGGLAGTFGEELLRGGQVVLRAAMFDEGWYLGAERQERDERRCCARVLWDKGESPWMKPLVDALTSFRIYKAYQLDNVKQGSGRKVLRRHLHSSGSNLWSLLDNWSSSPQRSGGRFDWVMAQARAAFPGVFERVEFDMGLPFILKPGMTDPADGLPPDRAADGLLTGLLHLTAVAGAPTGSIVAIDEMENQLHPHAIRALIGAMRERAEAEDLTVILTTHSPVVMNEFKGDEESFFVLDPTVQRPMPVPLEEHRDAAWLSHFALGDLYERSAIAAPKQS